MARGRASPRSRGGLMRVIQVTTPPGQLAFWPAPLFNAQWPSAGTNADKLLMEAKVVPSGVAEVAKLQAKEGFVYLRP